MDVPSPQYMQEIQPRVIGACAIVVGEVEVTPSASHVFALLLAFALAPADPWTRRGLQELLFGGIEEHLAAHRLRQLLYRLRGFGVMLQEASSGVIRLVNPVVDPLDLLDADDLVAPPRSSVRLDPLALYTPRMPAPFLDWLEQRRDVLRSALAARRVGVLRAARQRQDWPACARMAAALHVVDPIDEEVVLALAESTAMLGRRDAALDTIDQFLRDTGDPLEARPALKRLRGRIASTRIPRREGTLRGRTECLAFLAEQWDRTLRGGGGRVSLLSGPPGIGKSRVGEVFAASTRLGGGQVIQLRCDSHARQTPLGLFTQLVPDLRRRRGSIGADPALGGALDLIAPGPIATTPPTATAEARRDEVKRAIVDLLEAVSAEQPLLLVVDDAHLLDEASRGVIRWLADSTNSAQVLVLLLCRPRPDGQSLVSASPRFGSYTLPPLDGSDSQALLLELSEPRPLTEAQLAWAIAEAGGNAFYLHALAQHPSDSVALPAHITSLAQTSYMGVSADARTVLDSCLLLDSLATPARVAHVAAVDDRTLLAAVRELEDVDLLRYEEGLFTGPHAIIRDVLDDLMPTTARAVLHHRIAQMLSAECADPARARIVGWAAVRSWLACGEPVAAVELALRVARQAATVGEPELGAVLINRIPREILDLNQQRTVLDAIIELADVGQSPTLMSEALAERTHIALHSAEGDDRVLSLILRSIATDFIYNKNYHVGTLTNIIANPGLPVHLAIDACAWMLAAADIHFDTSLARTAFAQLSTYSSRAERNLASYLRGSLIYHTSYGERNQALSLARRILSEYHPLPSLDDSVWRSRAYAVLALLRLGFYEEVVTQASLDWPFMKRNAHFKGAHYFASVIMEAYIAAGDLKAARDVLSDVRREVGNREDATRRHPPATYSAATYLAIDSGDFDEANRLLLAAREAHGTAGAVRLRSARLGYEVLLRHRRGEQIHQSEEMRMLIQIFASAKRFGGQDLQAAIIWMAQREAGDEDAASAMLADYLHSRRELGRPSAILSRMTGTDHVWRTWHRTNVNASDSI